MTRNRAISEAAADRGIGCESAAMADLLADPSILEPPRVLIPHLVWHSRVTLLAAREKTGKSTLIAAACAAYTRHAPFLGEACETGGVLWVSADRESLGDQVRRQAEFNADPALIRNVVTWDQRPESVFAHIRELGPYCSIVVIDTLASFLATSISEGGSSMAWVPWMLAIKALAEEQRLGIVLNHHASKISGEYRDSTAIGAGVDAIIEMKPVDTTRRKLVSKAKWHVDDVTVKLDGHQYVLDRGAAASNDARLLSVVTAKAGLSTVALASELKMRKQEVVDALGRLEASGMITRVKSGSANSWHPTVPVSGTTGNFQ